MNTNKWVLILGAGFIFAVIALNWPRQTSEPAPEAPEAETSPDVTVSPEPSTQFNWREDSRRITRGDMPEGVFKLIIPRKPTPGFEDLEQSHIVRYYRLSTNSSGVVETNLLPFPIGGTSTSPENRREYNKRSKDKLAATGHYDEEIEKEEHLLRQANNLRIGMSPQEAIEIMGEPPTRFEVPTPLSEELIEWRNFPLETLEGEHQFAEEFNFVWEPGPKYSPYKRLPIMPVTLKFEHSVLIRIHHPNLPGNTW